MNDSGTDRTALTFSGDDDSGFLSTHKSSPVWPPDGTRIAFATGTDLDSNGQIHLMNADRTEVRILTDQLDGLRGLPAWSPDGNRIMFCSRQNRLEVVDVETTAVAVTQRTACNRYLPLQDRSHREPSWSPDGTKIAFNSSRQGNYDINVMDSNGDSQVRLTCDSATDKGPSWSPGTVPDVIESPLCPNLQPLAETRLSPVAGPTAVPLPTSTPIPTLAPEPPCIPHLTFPNEGAIMANGRLNRQDGIIRDFDWDECPGASAYQLHVIGSTAIFLLINKSNHHGLIVPLYQFWVLLNRAQPSRLEMESSCNCQRPVGRLVGGANLRCRGR